MSCLSTLSNETYPKHIRNIAKTDPKTKSTSQCTVFGKKWTIRTCSNSPLCQANLERCRLRSPCYKIDSQKLVHVWSVAFFCVFCLGWGGYMLICDHILTNFNPLYFVLHDIIHRGTCRWRCRLKLTKCGAGRQSNADRAVRWCRRR